MVSFNSLIAAVTALAFAVPTLAQLGNAQVGILMHCVQQKNSDGSAKFFTDIAMYSTLERALAKVVGDSAFVGPNVVPEHINFASFPRNVKFSNGNEIDLSQLSRDGLSRTHGQSVGTATYSFTSPNGGGASASPFFCARDNDHLVYTVNVRDTVVSCWARFYCNRA
ncbi:hypothetical protein HDU67_002078 [Dinochytrium kinnereticum]|nr:hypothetical protein HDU67_002078 [Dinochytrium kinnereticum]